MGLKGGWACLKYTVFIVNFLFWLAGIGILAIALYMRFVVTADIPDSRTATYLLMAAGGVITLIGFLGCCGACKESTCMLLTFFFFLLIILVLEIAAGVLIVKNRSEVESRTRNTLVHLFKDYTTDPVKKVSVDRIQQNFACCGIDGPTSWQNNLNINVTYTVPKSCCADINSEKCEAAITIVGQHIPEAIYSTGCLNLIMDVLRKHMTLLIGVAFGVGGMEIFGLIFSMMLCCAIRND